MNKTYTKANIIETINKIYGKGWTLSDTKLITDPNGNNVTIIATAKPGYVIYNWQPGASDTFDLKVTIID